MVHYLIHPRNPQIRILEQVVDLLKNHNGLCIYPTDTVYGLGACVCSHKAIDTIGRLLLKNKKRLFSFICCDFSQASRYAKISTNNYRIIKRYLPGPYTFILPVTAVVPKQLSEKRKTVGIRIPQCEVCIELVSRLGEPLANTSLNTAGHLRGNPDLFAQDSAVIQHVDCILDIGPIDSALGSTIIDLTGEQPMLIRKGKGPWDEKSY